MSPLHHDGSMYEILCAWCSLRFDAATVFAGRGFDLPTLAAVMIVDLVAT